MARLPYVDPDHAPEHVSATLRALPPMTMIRTIANADDVLSPWIGFAGAVLNNTTLDPVHREIAILRVATLSPGADYEWDQHEVIARQVGATEAQIEAVRTGSGLEGDDELVARFTEEVVRDVSPSDATFEQARERFTPRQLVELLLLIGHYMMIARLAATVQVDSDPPIGLDLFDDLQRASES
jgi:4-carboxymuconolactone decarboxylase